MDLVSRLKEYIGKTNIPVTQFADICGIARPTLSQLLNGRNKKVSDEIVAKIHAAFPTLSVYWLMFGEGEMEVAKNIELSEGKNTVNCRGGSSLLFDNQDDVDAFVPSDKPSGDDRSGIIEFFDRDKYHEGGSVGASAMKEGLSVDSSVKDGMPLIDKCADDIEEFKNKAVAIKVNQGEGRRISNIVVFYSDNSFQSFYPA